jgi:hypothetical protein
MKALKLRIVPAPVFAFQALNLRQFGLGEFTPIAKTYLKLHFTLSLAGAPFRTEMRRPMANL